MSGITFFIRQELADQILERLDAGGFGARSACVFALYDSIRTSPIQLSLGTLNSIINSIDDGRFYRTDSGINVHYSVI